MTFRKLLKLIYNEGPRKKLVELKYTTKEPKETNSLFEY